MVEELHKHSLYSIDFLPLKIFRGFIYASGNLYIVQRAQGGKYEK